ASLGIAQLETMAADLRERWAKRVAIVTGVAAAILLAAGSGMITSLAPAMRADAAYAAVADARIGLLLGAATVIALALVAWRLPRFIAAAAVLLIIVDLGTQIRRFIVIDGRGAEVFAADEGVKAMLADAQGTAQPWRALPLGRVYMDDYL